LILDSHQKLEVFEVSQTLGTQEVRDKNYFHEDLIYNQGIL